MSPSFLGLTVTLWPEASLSEHRAGCEPRTGRWGWGWGWAEWPQTGCSSGPLPGWAAGHPSSQCSSEPAALPHLMFSVPASWCRAASFKTRGIQVFWSGLPWSKTQTEENRETRQWDWKLHHKVKGHRVYSITLFFQQSWWKNIPWHVLSVEDPSNVWDTYGWVVFLFFFFFHRNIFRTFSWGASW